MEMKTFGGVEVEFDVVQPPKPRQCMEHHVLEVDRKIEQQHRDHNRDPDRRVDVVEEAPATRLGHDRQPDREDWERQPQDDRIDHDECEVIRPADHARDFPPASRGRQFPHRHCRQNTQKDGKSDGRLGGKDGLGLAALALGLVRCKVIAIILVIS